MFSLSQTGDHCSGCSACMQPPSWSKHAEFCPSAVAYVVHVICIYSSSMYCLRCLCHLYIILIPLTHVLCVSYLTELCPIFSIFRISLTYIPVLPPVSSPPCIAAMFSISQTGDHCSGFSACMQPPSWSIHAEFCPCAVACVVHVICIYSSSMYCLCCVCHLYIILIPVTHVLCVSYLTELCPIFSIFRISLTDIPVLPPVSSPPCIAAMFSLSQTGDHCSGISACMQPPSWSIHAEFCPCAVACVDHVIFIYLSSMYCLRCLCHLYIILIPVTHILYISYLSDLYPCATACVVSSLFHCHVQSFTHGRSLQWVFGLHATALVIHTSWLFPSCIFSIPLCCLFG